MRPSPEMTYASLTRQGYANRESLSMSWGLSVVDQAWRRRTQRAVTTSETASTTSASGGSVGTASGAPARHAPATGGEIASPWKTPVPPT